MRQLDVFIDRRLVGALHEGEDIWRFEYDPAWCAATDAYDLGPGLPRAERIHVDGGTHRPVQWYFDNLLPEELLRQAISKEAGIKGDDAFALLEYLGAESAGALTLLPAGTRMPDTASFQELPDAALSQRIAQLPRHTLNARSPKRMSLAGAQHKLLVICHDGRLYEPEGATPSTHILKPGHPDTDSYPASVVNEYVTMRLAGAAGLTVPPVQLRYVPDPVYIVDRFDRQVTVLDRTGDRTRRADGGRNLPLLDVRRLHIIDACQLLNRARTFKHSGASLEALLNIVERTTNKLHSRLQLFRWLVFNIVAANDDCHLKNLSFFTGPDGIKLAPHYDLLATGAYHTRALADDLARWPEVPLAIGLPGARVFGEVTRDSVLNAGRELGVPLKAAQRILAEVLARVPSALAREAHELKQRLAAQPAAVKPHLAIEARFMRVLTSIIAKDMLARLQR